jgi:ATP-dependent Clp protease protease subunit
VTFSDRTADALHLQMLEARVVLAHGVLDDDLATRVATELMTLDAGGDAPVRLMLNSGGGSLSAAFTLIDVIDLLGVPVHATCIGRAEGPAVGVLAVATRRLALPHARMRLCAADDAFTGRADDVATWAARHDAETRRFCARIAEATRRPASWIETAMREGRWFDAHEAMRAGLVDEITQTSAAPAVPVAARPIGFRPPRP